MKINWAVVLLICSVISIIRHLVGPYIAILTLIIFGIVALVLKLRKSD